MNVMSFLLLFLVSVWNISILREGSRKSADSGQNTSFQAEYGEFENYAFVLNGKVIEQQALVDHPGAVLDKIYPYHKMKLEGREYRGTVYFHTPDHPAPPMPYADDPAWFINGRQVSPFDIRSSRPELYRKIKKSVRDTVINGTLYNGSIHVDTDEDFFAGRLALPKILNKYSELPAEQLIIHWFSTMPPNTSESDIGMVIPDNFAIYHLDRTNAEAVKVDRIRFAEGERYVVNLIDNRNALKEASSIWVGSKKAREIFENPLTVDVDCTCYVPGFDTTISGIFGDVEIKPRPYGGEEAYLKKLSATMGLTAEKPAMHRVSDSITVQFLLTRNGLLAGLESTSSDKPGHAQILYAIKRNSCLWSAGIQSGRLVPATRRKMTIFYSKDQNGDIRSLDSLEYRPIWKGK